MKAPLGPIGLLATIALFAVFPGAQAAQAVTMRGEFSQPPYYDGKLKAEPRHAGHVTVAFRSEPSTIDPTPDNSPALATLLDSLRVEIDRQTRTTRLPLDVRLPGRPDIRFGVRRGGMGPDGIPLGLTEIDAREPRRMTFEVEGPSKTWKRDVAAAMPDSVSVVVSVQLGFDELWVRQKDWKGTKTIEIGTDRVVPVPWLTSLDDPVQVLLLTGAVSDRNGKVLRVGAEGLVARRTGMTASVVGVQEILTEEDLASVIEAPEGQDPVWRVAIRSLVANLLSVPGPK
jgi:hypothetical protein